MGNLSFSVFIFKRKPSPRWISAVCGSAKASGGSLRAFHKREARSRGTGIGRFHPEKGRWSLGILFSPGARRVGRDSGNTTVSSLLAAPERWAISVWERLWTPEPRGCLRAWAFGV